MMRSLVMSSFTVSVPLISETRRCRLPFLTECRSDHSLPSSLIPILLFVNVLLIV